MSAQVGKSWIAVGLCIGCAMASAHAQTTGGRSGREVVEAICAQCHASGKDGAPRIGDRQAWSKLAARGLTSLTQSALTGIRKMPAHGGSADATDLDISRAIAYMVNKSGGKWVEPAGKPAYAGKDAPVARTGKFLVESQCGKCHQTGANGAPRIGDRDAWVQRLKRGMDDVVRSAFNGHGPMPAKGGLSDVTINELRAAVTYMFNPASADWVAPIATPAQPEDPFHKFVGDTEIFFGVASAESIRAARNTSGPPAIVDVPDGRNKYHLNVTLRDRITKAIITDAQVDARVEDAAMRGESRSLDLIAINRSVSFGGFFEMPTKGPYRIALKIKRPGAPQPLEARFNYRRE
jgi:cytochrome c5